MHPIGRAVRERSKRERDREGKIVSREHLGGCGYRRPHRLPEKSLPESWPANSLGQIARIITRFRRESGSQTFTSYEPGNVPETIENHYITTGKIDPLDDAAIVMKTAIQAPRSGAARPRDNV